MIPQRPVELIVEGENDQHVISNLLWKHEIRNYRVRRNEKFETETRPLDEVLITVAGSRSELLRIIATRLKSGDRSAIGFVVDADQDAETATAAQRTWQAIHDQLCLAALDSTEPLTEAGWDGIDSRFESRFGFWVMPDNQRSGAIENFLLELIDSKDLLIGYAEIATKTAKDEHTAPFQPTDFLKAHLACWLAWQDEPGRPPGQAIAHDLFAYDHELAKQFLAWIRRLLVPVLPEQST